MRVSFQFLGIPPKGELFFIRQPLFLLYTTKFPISRDPPEGGTLQGRLRRLRLVVVFPISRDPPEGGTLYPD